MATAGLSFASPFMAKVNVGEDPNLFAPFSPTASMGAGNLAPSLADMAVTGEALTRRQQFSMPEMRRPPAIAFSPSRNELFVQGTTFAADDAPAVLRSEGLLRAPGTPMPTGGDWVPLDETAYQQLVQSIRQPSLGRLVQKNFGRGVDTMQALAGRGLQLAGTEDLGGRIVAAQEEDLRKTSPYERQFTDIESGRGAVEWFVANLAQQGPNLLESVLTAGLGFLAGTAAGTPAAGAGAALAGLMGKSAFKESVLAAARKQAAGTALSTAESKLLREAAGLAGAVTASYAQNIGTGAADIYGELREQGANAQDVDARLKALAGSIPYAALETLPEFVLASRVFGGVMAPTTLRAGASRTARGVELLRRGAIGGAVGGTLEGTTEAGQESLLLGISGQDMSSPENVKRLINSFAAGFGVGGPIGAVANLRGREPANLLDPAATPEPPSSGALTIIPPTPRPGFSGTFRQGEGVFVSGPGGTYMPSDERGVVPYSTPVTPMGTVSAAPAQLGGPAPLGLPAPAAPVSPMGGPVIMAGMGPGAVAYTDQMLQQQGNVPPTAPGTQGVLNVFGGAISAQELASRMQPPVAPAPAAPAAPPMVDTRQGALQFAPPAPVPTTGAAVGNAMQRAIQQRQAALAQQQRQQQLAAQREADLDRLAIAAAAQRQLDLVQPEARALPQARPGGATQPVQLPLFNRRQAPTPSRAEGLRRGVGTQIPPVQGVTPRTAAQRLAQVPLFTQEGEPSVAALKAAGVKVKVPAAPPKAQATKTAGSRGLKRQAGVVAVEIKEAPRATQEGKLKQGRVAERPQDNAGVRAGRDVGEQPKAQVPAGGTEAGGRGVALKRGAKQEVAAPAQEDRMAKILRNAETTQAGKQWGQYADPETQPKWADLTDAQKEAWRKVVIDERKPSIAAAEEIAPPKKEPPAPKAEAARVAAPAAPTETAEEQWTGMEDMPFENLPEPIQKQWRDAVAKGEATGELAAQLADDARIEFESSATTSLGELGDAIRTIEEATQDRVTPDVMEALTLVARYAFFTSEGTNTKKLVVQAQQFLDNTQFTDAQLAAMDEAFMAEVGKLTFLEAQYKDGGKKGAAKPWFTYAVSRGLLPSIKARIVNLPTQYKTQALEPVRGKIALPSRPEPTSSQRMTAAPEARLGELIGDLITRIREYSNLDQPVKFYGESFNNIVDAATRLFARVSEAGRKYIVRGYPLSEYFTADGTPKMLKTGGRFVITNKEMTTAEQRKLEQEQRAEAKALSEEAAAARLAEFERAKIEKEGFKDEDAWDSPDGMFYRDDGSPMGAALPQGRVRLLVSSFVSKLRVKPTVNIFANVADLKKRDPALYRRAAAARAQGDFDTTNAVGYSFGNRVIIFTDFVRSEQQLRFVLAHETLGHFGFRAVVPGAQLDKVLEQIYQRDPDVQAAVDAMMSVHGMSKLEAVEEYLADNAADLDASVIARVWNVVKNFLNKLGIQFEDDLARYMVNQARKYVRQGDGGTFFNARTMSAQMEQLDTAQVSGRFARIMAGDMGSRVFAAGGLNRRMDATGGFLGAVEAFAKDVFGKRRDVPGTLARLAETLQTLDNKARRSYGLSQLYRLMEQQQQFSRSLLSKYQRMTQFTHSATIESLGVGKGVTEDQKQTAGELLARAALLRSAQATDELIKSFDPLVDVDAMGNVTVNEDVRRQIETAGRVTADEFRKGFDITYTDGSKVRFQFDVDENSAEWKVYNELRDTVNEAAIDMMLANYEAAQAESKRVVGDLNKGRTTTNIFTAADLAAIRRAAELYKARRYAGSGVANAGVEIRKKAEKDSEAFVVAFGRALFNDDVYAVWMKTPGANEKIAKDMEEFLTAEYDDIRAALPGLRAKIRGDEEARKAQSYTVQKAIRDLFLFDLQSRNADYHAKRTILGSYVPFARRGTEQVRLVATDARGNAVALSENIRSALPYFQFDSRSEALDAAAELEKQFGADNEFVLTDADGNEVTVRLRAEVSRVRQTPDLTEAVNFNEFVYVLNRLNINLTPDVRERIVTTLTAQNARARKNLQRSGTEGWDKDVVRSVSEHLETSAHVSAKKLHRHRVDDVLLRNSNWLGDPQMLANLEAAVTTAATPADKARAQRAYDEYAYMYRYMRAAAGENTVVINGKKVPTLGRGEDYREDAKELLRWYAESTNITDSTEDMLSGEAGSALKMITVLMQLGGSVATAAVNLMSLASHSLPYLSHYNSARGFGGGYGQTKAATALWKAASDVKNFNLSDDLFLQQILKDGSFARYGLTREEVEFLFAQTEQGTLQAAQFNALVGTARGKVFNNKAQAAVKAWMSLFSYTEQFNRRVTALAAYRLEKDRLRAQGVTDNDQLVREATEAARVAVTASQGEYAMFNRPAMARGNVLQYVFMYKQFVITTVQLLRNMPPKGQMLALGLLLLMSGLKGLPFAEDIFDVVDTIAQKLGLKMASVEKELTEWLDAVAPGAAPFIMRGGFDRWLGATISTRLGMGDLLPLTGAFKAGADPAREAENFAGPVFSGIAGLVGTVAGLTKYGAETIGLRDDTTSLTGILRDSPLAAVRGIVDGLLYLDSGMITNNRGQVVSKEAPYHVIIARMLGFYPSIATEQNDIVRISKDVANYAKAIKAEYVSAYVKAKLDNDTARMQEIVADVQQWNADAKGTGLEITAFSQSANRAAMEASRPTALRYLKSAPKQMRPETMELLRINGLEDEIR